MDIQQIRLGKMATFCYIVGDPPSQTCALIDPAFETGRILKSCEAKGYRVSHLINTHGHADHTAGNAKIVERTGAKLCIHAADARALSRTMNKAFARVLGGKGSPEPDVRLNDHDVITVGEVKLNVLHTPGHTPGSICLYTEGHVFTGDTLFVGGIGRTDLPGGSFGQLLSSIKEHIYTLPADTVIWPGHDYGSEPFSTVKREMETNPFTK
jgi:glyoxylase-like metal-dependent hydrolase (beta-lactamase superfamily II)